MKRGATLISITALISISRVVQAAVNFVPEIKVFKERNERNQNIFTGVRFDEGTKRSKSYEFSKSIFISKRNVVD